MVAEQRTRRSSETNGIGPGWCVPFLPIRREFSTAGDCLPALL